MLLRVSSPGQEDGYSLSDQERDGKAHCQKMGYRLNPEHIWNDGAQHSFTLDRPGLLAAGEAMRTGAIQVLVVGRYDRFSRIQMQQAVAIYQLEQVYGGRVESADPKEQFGRDSTGTLLRSVNAWRAEQELELIRARTQSGRKSRVQSGKLLAGPHPLYGYTWADPHERRGKTRYLVDEATAPIVRRIFREIAAGRSLRQIAQGLMADHVPTPGTLYVERGWIPPGRFASETQWLRQRVRRIASHPAYAGQFVAYRLRMSMEQDRGRDGTLRLVRRTRVRAEDDPQRIVLPASVCPPIVSLELWEQVQRQLDRNKAEAVRNTKHATAYLLRGGLAVCGYCHRRLAPSTSNANSQPYLTYRCPAAHDRVINPCPGGRLTMRAVYLDTMVWAGVQCLFANPERIRTILANRRQDEDQEDERFREHLTVEEGYLKQVERRIENARRSSLDATEEEARAFWAMQLQQLLPEQRTLQEHIADLQRLHAARSAATTYLDTVEQWAKELGSAIADATYEEKRYLLRGLRARVTCYRADHDPHFLVEWDLAGLREVYHHLLPALTDQEIAQSYYETHNTL